MSSTESVTHWIHGLRAGAPDAAGPLFERYFHRLIRLAHVKLQGVPQRAVSAEDVAAHAFASFCLRLERGDFAPLEDRDDLWRLLARIVANKALKVIRRHRAEKHGGGKVRGESVWTGVAEEAGQAAGIDQEEGNALPADVLVEMNEEFQRRLDALADETLRSIALWALEGWSNQEMADRLGVAPQTIERKRKRIRSIWGQEADQ